MMNTNNSYPQIDFGRELLSSAQQDALEACHFCEGPILDSSMVGSGFCSERCSEKHADNLDEAAYEHITSGVAQ